MSMSMSIYLFLNYTLKLARLTCKPACWAVTNVPWIKKVID